MSLFDKQTPLEKYIAEVKGYLPSESRNDIAEELQTNIEAKISDMPKTSGAAKGDAAIIQLLSDYGHPLRVAAQYQGKGRSLIGPDFYPFYRTAIVASLSISTVILIALIAIDFFFTLDIGDVSIVWMFVNTYIYIIGIITGGFFLAERIIERNHFLDSWSPSKTAPPDKALATAWGAIFSVVAAITMLVILNMVNLEHSTAVLMGQTRNPFHTLVFWMKIQLVFLIPQYVYLVIDQNWSRAQLYLRTVTEAILLTGCLITLRMDTSAFRSIYPELPDSLFSIFNLALWLIIIGILISVAVYWRRKAEVAFTRSSQQ
ncbi:MAG TPA: hypothetical protein DCM64_08055 [Gammaproteobacteria bacterium]|jgi:hypothetical protein|nr:hypothetical protein [Gammaproteobacteria bacterium]MDP6733358.1 hypothetical protein [Gammaproteobacteria bacterium]HAJ76396.1 hypothetical protein [Gammaproteobacteria bacterium]|tara:strand:+ start:1310 stop:2260 length:951 start_codon:yes stop_codon:yes gene_type:complete